MSSPVYSYKETFEESEVVQNRITITVFIFPAYRILTEKPLSRSVFAKPHIRGLLEKYNIRNPSQKCNKKDGPTHRDKIEERIRRLTEENSELKRECELLRGRLFLLMQKEQK